YANELEKESWAKGDTIMRSVDSANLSRSVVNKALPEGWYVIEATAKDKDGFEVKDIKYILVFDEKKTAVASPVYQYTLLSGSEFQPGDKATMLTGTSATDVFLIQQEIRAVKTNDRDTLQASYKFASLNKEKKTYDFTITENDRGGFTVLQFFIKDNRIYDSKQVINVPWRNKQLDVTYTTFRDKTLPGSQEQWKVKINGYKGEKVAAEMLTTMYDASLDQFNEHGWQVPDVWPNNFSPKGWDGYQNFGAASSIDKLVEQNYIEAKEKIFRDFIFSGNFGHDARVRFKTRGVASDAKLEMNSNYSGSQEVVVPAMGVKKGSQLAAPKVGIYEQMLPTGKQISQAPGTIIRKHFNETAFFFPQLNTDKDGNIEFSFTMPEALTTWKLLTLAHTKELAFGYNERSLITQKDLMIQANAPRFLREGDRMEFSANVTNLTDKEITGQAELQLLEASTMKPVDGLFKNIFPSQYFTIEANKTNGVKFTLEVPFNFTDALVYRIIAKSGNKSDGEEAALPILTNRMLVTETLPLHTRGDSVKHFSFDKLRNSGKSETLKSRSLTIEYSTNPAWYAIQSLPYLAEPKYECADYLFNSYYSNTLAQYIINSSPKIAEVFKLWQKDTANFKSNLQKNEELKSVLLQETPWLLEAMNETAQMQQLADLFDAAKLSLALNTTFKKLAEWQSPNGGFMWFKGGPEDRYITQYIIIGVARLLNLKAVRPSQDQQVKAMIAKALPYLDAAIKKDFDEIKKSKQSLKISYPFYPQSITAQYFYLRSLLPEYKVPEKIQAAYNYYKNQLKAGWLNQNKYTQAMIALSLYRTNDKSTATAILRSLKENAIVNEELGMYWKDWTTGGYLWYQAPIESQAMMIEAFTEIGNDGKAVDDLKTWLLKNKQTNSWVTSRATADASYALLLKGSDWLSVEQKVNITVGDTLIESDKLPQQAGTGYFKYVFTEHKVTPEMGNISVKVSSAVKPVASTWGGAYWQYFEDLDKIAFAQTPLRVNKKLFITTNTDRGPVLKPITDNAGLKVGDKITVRIELRADRDMEYIHMKDMRAACMEPVNVLSTYKYQGGLGYYESTKDASTNFFFSYLPKGSYVFEYNLFVTHNGNFSNGITSIQCLYAPQFTAHSEGVRVNVE
ncbi:MAG: alpha-2-macroglobulin family protein, partial [Ginsengibacter sp.]